MKPQFVARALAGFAMLAVTGVALPALADNTYLEFHATGGPAVEPGSHNPAWIKVSSDTFSLPIPPPKGSGAASKVPPADSSLTVTGVDNATAQTLLQDALNGTPLSWVRLIVEKVSSNGTMRPSEIYTFTNAYVTAASQNTSGKTTTDTFAFNYLKVTMKHEGLTSGTPGKTASDSWITLP
jgi:type VI protein secretion system component Hcp